VETQALLKVKSKATYMNGIKVYEAFSGKWNFTDWLLKEQFLLEHGG
jgi:hypothetical protein